eukprot:7377340-Prymnesium_polylepis.3
MKSRDVGWREDDEVRGQCWDDTLDVDSRKPTIFAPPYVAHAHRSSKVDLCQLERVGVLRVLIGVDDEHCNTSLRQRFDPHLHHVERPIRSEHVLRVEVAPPVADLGRAVWGPTLQAPPRMTSPSLAHCDRFLVCQEGPELGDQLIVSKAHPIGQIAHLELSRERGTYPVRARASEHSRVFASHTHPHHVWVGPTSSPGQRRIPIEKSDCALEVAQPVELARVDVSTRSKDVNCEQEIRNARPLPAPAIMLRA